MTSPPSADASADSLARGTSASVGDSFEVVVGPVAHGGHCVARHEGQVVFVRHALPGERVVVRVTELGSGGRFVRADAIEVREASGDRVVPPCPYAAPGRCGGCDWQHATLPAQRELKASVVREALRGIGRLAGSDAEALLGPLVVEAVPGDVEGLGWRTRVQYAVRPDGHAGLRRHRSHEIEPVETCLIAAERVRSVGVETRRWESLARVEVLTSGLGERAVVLTPSGPLPEELPDLPDDVDVVTADGGGRTTLQHGRGVLDHEVSGRRFAVHVPGFWQVHLGAAQVLADAVVAALEPRAGESACDLYGGAGLFAGVLAPLLGPGGRVILVESDRAAVLDAVTNLAGEPTVRVVRGEVGEVLAGRDGGSRLRRADLVVLDPPRAGAGSAVVRSVVRLRPRRIAYVACDPAALARDLRTFADLGYVLEGLRAFDLFPMTHHVECLATLRPA